MEYVIESSPEDVSHLPAIAWCSSLILNRVSISHVSRQTLSMSLCASLACACSEAGDVLHLLTKDLTM